MIKLTVAIPTYGRNEILKTNLTKLLPQLTEECELIILDNCSPVPVTESLLNLLTQYPNFDIRVIRHVANVGGDENTFRCIEYASGDYIWWLGDDDCPSPGAVANILKIIKLEEPPLVINMLASVPGHKPRTSTVGFGSVSYLESFSQINEAIFISCMIFKRQSALNFMPALYHWQSSCAAQLFLVANMLRGDRKFLVSNEPVIQDAGHARSEEAKSDFWNPLVGLNSVLLLPWTEREFNSIKKLAGGNWLLFIGFDVIRSNLKDCVTKKISWQAFKVRLRALRRSAFTQGFFSKLAIFYMLLSVIIYSLGPQLTLIFMTKAVNFYKTLLKAKHE